MIITENKYKTFQYYLEIIQDKLKEMALLDPTSSCAD